MARIFLKSDRNPIGMIVPSMLTLAQFQAINGTTWVLANGASVSGSAYATITGNSTVPDLRGMFLRGKNNGRADTNEDPGGERSLGNLQADEFKSHRHDLVVYDSAGSGNNYPTDYFPNVSVTGTNTTAIQPTGGIETRPKNIAVNYFIKINS
jgi:hypothetical protein